MCHNGIINVLLVDFNFTLSALAYTHLDFPLLIQFDILDKVLKPRFGKSVDPGRTFVRNSESVSDLFPIPAEFYRVLSELWLIGGNLGRIRVNRRGKRKGGAPLCYSLELQPYRRQSWCVGPAVQKSWRIHWGLVS